MGDAPWSFEIAFLCMLSLLVRIGFWLGLAEEHRGLLYGSGTDSAGLATALCKYKHARAQTVTATVTITATATAKVTVTVTVMLTVTVTVTATLTMTVTLCFGISAEQALFRIVGFADLSAPMTS